MRDVVVVGARCAGAPLAMLLARAGRRVTLVDRDTFPSDTLSTHFLWPRGAAWLQDWGVLERLWARGCVPIRQISFDVGDVALKGNGTPVGPVVESLCPRRTVLDTVLVEAAVEAGAELVDDYVVDDVAWSEGRAVGVVGHDRRSRTASTIRAHAVVGADGLRSTVAARVGASTYRYSPPSTCVYYAYWSGVSSAAAGFYARPGQLVLVWPTNDRLTCVYVARPVDEYARVRADVGAAFGEALRRVPEVDELLASGRRETRFTGTRTLPFLYRESAGPGWALVGDAWHYQDPCTGTGITDAFRSADLLARALSSDDEPGRLTARFAGCQAARDAETAAGFELSLKTARLAPPSAQMAELYRAAASDPALSERVFGVLSGGLPISDLRLGPGRVTAPSGG